MTETTPQLRLNMIMLAVTDLEASVHFYTERLGFALQRRFGDFAFVDGNGTILVLSAELAQSRPPTASAPVEIVLAVDGVRSAYDALRARGVVFENEPHTVDGTNDVANFSDPDGHLFALYGLP